MRVHRRTLASTAVALLGIVVTAALTWSVSRLAAQHIGLSSAPPSAIRGLAPPRPEATAPHTTEDSRPGRPRSSRSSADGSPATVVTSAMPTPTVPTSTAPTPAPAGTASPSPPAGAPSSGSGQRGGEDGGDSARRAVAAGGRDD